MEKSHGCTFTWGNGDKYVGKYQDGKSMVRVPLLGQMVQSTLVNSRMAKHGQGNTYAEGDKYVGKYQDGKRHGEGT